jgi:hypothetical protein
MDSLTFRIGTRRSTRIAHCRALVSALSRPISIRPPHGTAGCQWNGPSWPFQTSQALTALANLLNDYHQSVITRADYLRLLRQYTHQHLLSPDHPDIQEDYNPDTGTPIVGLARSHHYNHSTYIDLILSELIGIRPRTDTTLEINPLRPAETALDELPIHYFAIQNLVYHSHNVSVFYDWDGTRYGVGRELSVFIDGKRAAGPGPLKRTLAPLPLMARTGSDRQACPSISQSIRGSLTDLGQLRHRVSRRQPLQRPSTVGCSFLLRIPTGGLRRRKAQPRQAGTRSTSNRSAISGPSNSISSLTHNSFRRPLPFNCNIRHRPAGKIFPNNVVLLSNRSRTAKTESNFRQFIPRNYESFLLTRPRLQPFVSSN